MTLCRVFPRGLKEQAGNPGLLGGLDHGDAPGQGDK